MTIRPSSLGSILGQKGQMSRSLGSKVSYGLPMPVEPPHFIDIRQMLRPRLLLTTERLQSSGCGLMGVHNGLSQSQYTSLFCSQGKPYDAGDCSSCILGDWRVEWKCGLANEFRASWTVHWRWSRRFQRYLRRLPRPGTTTVRFLEVGQNVVHCNFVFADFTGVVGHAQVYLLLYIMRVFGEWRHGWFLIVLS